MLIIPKSNSSNLLSRSCFHFGLGFGEDGVLSPATWAQSYVLDPKFQLEQLIKLIFINQYNLSNLRRKLYMNEDSRVKIVLMY